MGSIYNRLAAGVTAIAASLCFNTASAQSSAPITAGEFKQLNEMFSAAGSAGGEKSQSLCEKELDSSASRPLGNKDMARVLALDEFLATVPAKAARAKAELSYLDRAGYRYCFDERLNGTPFAAALHPEDRAISLNPTALNPDRSLYSQQMALAITINALINQAKMGAIFPKGEPVGVIIHPGTLAAYFSITPQVSHNFSPAPVVDRQPREKKREKGEFEVRYTPPAFPAAKAF